MRDKKVIIELKNITKKFGSVTVVNQLNLSIYEGEMLTLLGSSGCGKSTTLNMITGSLTPDSGEIYIRGNDLTYVPSHKREIGLVFQNFALFPHMTVFEIVEFPLKIRKENKKDRKVKVMEMLRLVQLDHLAERYPRELSGGQQQRVGLARALIYEPKVVLFDEPLSNLDAKLREELRFEIMNLKDRLKFTSIYVTHDQEEALTLSDRIAVMKNGVIQQLGTPHEIYNEPQTLFVADFVGISNKIVGQCVDKDNGHASIQSDGFHLSGVLQHNELQIGDQVMVFIRPEDIQISHEASAKENTFQGEVRNIVFSGERKECMVSIEEGITIRLYMNKQSDIAIGQKLFVHLPSSSCKILKHEEMVV
ncbi:ABC transporter ATP-binding protein [Paenibacillus sp. BR2-3]|uniref:ABC transporter ATP-binding protein n=1 Tax=Paenibacillus sp. BR2-3 TaxID=3048494 RepID=UPI003977DDC9